MRILITCEPPTSQSRPTWFAGRADFSRLFCAPGAWTDVPKAHWVLWFAHHLLGLFRNADDKDILLSTGVFCGEGVRALPGFLEGFKCTSQPLSPAQADITWTRSASDTPTYHSPDWGTIHVGAPGCTTPDTLAPSPSHNAHPFRECRTYNRHFDPMDFEIVMGSLFMGAMDAYGDPKHGSLGRDPVFTLLSLLGTFDLPNGQAFPQRSNNGWGCGAFNTGFRSGANAPLLWASTQHIIRPTGLFCSDSFTRGTAWERAQHADPQSACVRAFGRALHPIAHAHAPLLAILQEQARTEAKSHSTPTPLSGHEQMARTALRSALIKAATAAGVLG